MGSLVLMDRSCSSRAPRPSMMGSTSPPRTDAAAVRRCVHTELHRPAVRGPVRVSIRPVAAYWFAAHGCPGQFGHSSKRRARPAESNQTNQMSRYS